ncbi:MULTISPECIES: MBL fold metallo-hydrolase [unclassified Sphingomonas]|uniref:MBL fold metallo-hydrolase n=1 Tax=unclassified Sphingomonas TaxID=196159 RepID=UPI0006F87F6A|nr:MULTISPECIES: MBL fold metallo-hydrolase [unclassified Sphingomonas]KQM67028.1 MBL fold metallo-hydrolase [Sphingomonas sp. Leaf16]KQN17975.1 MBL fold metallo-hydrolase [Sphingomonas sp. Leaf29]KQN23838.1 MBL fold metallo-hydrolase [Sphingomonas sp. Leaf32]
MKIRILGSGTSSGVPRIGNDWGACDPAEPRNRRTRVSALIEYDGTRILIDTGPDMREQLLAADVATVDAVLWTHDHADHCHGIDDLRQLFHNARVPVAGFARAATLKSLQSRFEYVFAGRAGYRATVSGALLPDSLTIGPVTIRCTDQPHGSIESAGLRFDTERGSIGYATDFSAVTPGMLDLYNGVDILVVDALRVAPHPTHPSLDEAIAFARNCRAGRTVLIHMDHSMDYATLRDNLPAGIEPGYDGMELGL